MSESESAAVKTPLVTIGLSVFNGEALLEEAIRSVQAQTHTDFELILCDSASGDRTAEICRKSAARDPRIHYHRAARNLGHRAAYNVALRHARGRYFKWLLHEDRLLPSCVESLTEVLDARRDVLLCNSIIGRIDYRGRSLGLLGSGLNRADTPSEAARFIWGVTDPLASVDFYSGMGRTTVLRELQQPGEYAWLAHLAMRGRFAQVPAVLQEMREPAARRSFWQEVRGPAPCSWQLHSEYLKLLSQSSLSRQERMRCLGVLAQAWAPGCERAVPAIAQFMAMVRKAPLLAARSRAAQAQMAQRRRF